MNSNRPYLIRAIYEWIVDNQCTPTLLVDAHARGASVPIEYIEDGEIVLNVAPDAVRNLIMGNSLIEFDARFASGRITHVCVPVNAVFAIYPLETGEGMFFEEEVGSLPASDLADHEGPSTTPPKGGKPHLRRVK